MPEPIGNKNNYLIIARLINSSFVISSIVLLILHLRSVDDCMDYYFGDLISVLIKQFFFGTIGATIACSMFLSKDKDINEIESLKDPPDLEILRYPTKEDVHLYFQRIYTSGILAIAGVLVLLAGFGYVEVDVNKLELKHKVLFALSSVLIGLFQSKFYSQLSGLVERIFSKKGDEKNPAEKGESKNKNKVAKGKSKTSKRN